MDINSDDPKLNWIKMTKYVLNLSNLKKIFYLKIKIHNFD